MPIDYPANQTFKLLVKDTGTLDQFDVFVNGTLRSHVSSGNLQSWPIERPTDVIAIAVHFEGTDGGISAIVNATDPTNPSVLERQVGLKHSYLLQAT